MILLNREPKAQGGHLLMIYILEGLIRITTLMIYLKMQMMSVEMIQIHQSIGMRIFIDIMCSIGMRMIMDMRQL